MGAAKLCLVVLTVLAVVSHSTARLTVQNCICQQRSGFLARGRMVTSSSCYVLGVGYCGRFTVEPTVYQAQPSIHALRRINTTQRRLNQSLRPSRGQISAAQRRLSLLHRTFSQQQRRRAQQAAQTQLSQQRRLQQTLLRSGLGTVRRGSASAALAAEKRADAKSLALGQQALAQILYLQNLVGTRR